MHNKGAIPNKDAQKETKKVYSQALVLCFFLLMKMQWTFFFFGIVFLFIKSILHTTETVRFAEIKLQNEPMAVYIKSNTSKLKSKGKTLIWRPQ